MVHNTCSEPKYMFIGDYMDPNVTKLLRALYPLSTSRRISLFWENVKNLWFPWRNNSK